MNREIKFRIWDLSKNAFVENSASLHCFSQWVIDAHTGKVYNAVGTIDGDCHDSSNRTLDAVDYYFKQCRRTKKNKSGLKVIKKAPYVLQQFTGLKDKEGNCVYEGDIVSFGKTYKPYVVEWETTSGAWTANGYRFGRQGDYHVDIKRLTIIGNIFENPELLK